MIEIEIAIRYAWQLVGAPYVWGGETPQGFDCSGFVQEILASVGLDPPGDQTANAFLDIARVKWFPISTPERGAVCFYGKNGRASHIAFCPALGYIIEAGGGGSRTLTPADAAKHGAFVRVRPYNARKDLIGIFSPFEALARSAPMS
jgi:cell wall-associated NlpC family hydrolase